jgi:hypothetical protein
MRIVENILLIKEKDLLYALLTVDFVNTNIYLSKKITVT